ncbi:MAG: FAD-linked oxidase C-terminal domain-containing protein [Planctomycetota bacterium]
MNAPAISLPVRREDESPLARRLGEAVQGEVRFDRLSRTLYSTDAGIYEIAPLGVVLPKDVDDVVAVVNECRAAGVSIVARGAGTGLAGGAVGPGVQLDLSRHMNRIGPLDAEARTVEVEPGVVLDQLNAYLTPHSLHFAPDVASSSRATLGGMIANNSCGAHSIVYGRTVDHVAELTVVLADGEVVTFADRCHAERSDVILSAAKNPARLETLRCAQGDSRRAQGDSPLDADRASRMEGELVRIRDANYEEIVRRFPKILRSNGGYGLDRLGPPGTPADAVKVLCGSEGTLGIVVRAKLRLTPIPKCTGLVVLHFRSLLDALTTTLPILRHNPAAVELVDKLIVDAGRANAALAPRFDFLRGDPAALLVVEFFDDSDTALASRIDGLSNDREVMGAVYAASHVLEPGWQADVWKLRTSGLGLLMSKPGDAQPYSFVEDSAVDPSRLRDYIERFAAILDREGVHAGYYAHASVGCLHVKPVLNLKDAVDVERMRRIADAVSDLALEFGGAMTGEHGDGIVRSCWIEKMYGPRIMAAFKEVKRLFDPQEILNPHKIVDPWPMTEHLRYGPAFAAQSVKTHLDFTAHGGMAGLAGMCTGVGQCRQRFVDTMCPSYMATGDETHTTRGRANALRVALSNRGLLDGLDDPQLSEVMDLCLSCKACKTGCPTGVDMARLKAEYLARRNLVHGASRRARLIAELPDRLALAARFPRLSNVVARSAWVRSIIEHRYGLDRRVPPPRLATTTFRAWYRRHLRRLGHRQTPRGAVVYFVDTWTNYFTPQVGIATVKLLEHAGFSVHCPRTVCCGRPAISQGLLTDARQLAETNVQRLSRAAPPGVPIVGSEPSCILTLVDEYPQLVRTQGARRVASQTLTIESFLRRVLDEQPDALRFRRADRPVLYHAHCHQKAIVGSGDAVAVLRAAFGDRACEINSGCCGMAGSFGHEVEHYEVARAIGEQRLFPAIRDRGEAEVAVSGFSCRQQIEHHAGVRPKHVVEYLAELLV